MINITNEQVEFLSQYVQNLDILVSDGNIEELLTAIDDAIIDNILSNKSNPDEPDEIGVKIQNIYDQIYNQNID